MRRLDRDALNSAGPEAVGQVAMTVLNALQAFAPHQQALGLALAFRALADRYATPPQDVFAALGNLMAADGRRPELRAVRNYVEAEL